MRRRNRSSERGLTEVYIFSLLFSVCCQAKIQLSSSRPIAMATLQPRRRGQGHHREGRECRCRKNSVGNAIPSEDRAGRYGSCCAVSSIGD